MTDEELIRKFDNIWREINEWRRFRLKLAGILISGAFIVGIAWAEARLAIAGNAEELEKQTVNVDLVPKLQRNQEDIARGVNDNGKALRAIAKKLDVDLPERDTVTIEDGGPGPD